MNKQGKGNVLLWIVGFVAVGYLLNSMGIVDLSGILGKGAAAPVTPTGALSGCFKEGATITFGTAQEKDNPDTTIANENKTHRVWVNDQYRGYFLDGSTLSLNPPSGIPGTANYVAGDKV